MNRKPSIESFTWPSVASYNKTNDYDDFVHRWEEIRKRPVTKPTLVDYQMQLLNELLVYLEDEIIDGKTHEEIIKDLTFINLYSRSIELNIPLKKLVDTIKEAQINAQVELGSNIEFKKNELNRVNHFNLIHEIVQQEQEKDKDFNILSLRLHAIYSKQF
ncbi:hypothetical protein [Paenibacillus soyae]|uniref:Uncharacterized protein n=1 Tax=Paenibacillus soyae TaxID=2969249 RepID=A0A9X2SA36_9BACL|nr:hypothetical protein [Paenibacillus soyae]MCR2805685.1 hypothetical protein [Paenibacillus soyae]